LSQEQIDLVKKSIKDVLMISAKETIGIDDLQSRLLEFVNTGALKNNDTIVTNSRHYDALIKAMEEVQKVKQGLVLVYQVIYSQ